MTRETLTMLRAVAAGDLRLLSAALKCIETLSDDEARQVESEIRHLASDVDLLDADDAYRTAMLARLRGAIEHFDEHGRVRSEEK